MRVSRLPILTFVLLSAFYAVAFTQTVTLYSPHDPVTRKYNEGKACFSFKSGLLKEVTKSDWDLGYGFLRISEQDWFQVNFSGGNRSVIKDLGELRWEDAFTVPELEPLPVVEEGKQREITIDSSADTHQHWAHTTNIFAKVVLGHIYALHVKDYTADFYVLFRVDGFEQNKRCTISWRLTPRPPE